MAAVPPLLRYFSAAWNILFPRRCLVCGQTLGESEKYLCAACQVTLPLARLQGEAGNVVERLFYDIPGTQRGSAFLIYHNDNAAYRLIHRMKYHDRPDVGVELGRWMAYDLEGTSFFEGIDALVPVPLSDLKVRKRGYNQSERIAYGLSQVTGIPVRTDLVARVVHNPTQTNLTPEQRRQNVKGIFAVTDSHALRNIRKGNKVTQHKEGTPHILLIDDVITTGSTLRSLAETLTADCPLHISYLGAALAGQHLNVFKKGAN